MPPKGSPKGADKKGDKPPKDKPAPSGGGVSSSSDIFTFIFGFIFVGLIATAVFNRISEFLRGGGAWRSSDFLRGLIDFYESYKTTSLLYSLVLIGGLVFLVRKINAIRTEERKLLYPEKEVSTEVVSNTKWQRVIDHLESDNMSDWKLAIIEADILLDDMLEKMGYHGDSVGEKLKQVEKSDFTTVDKAWEAHKIRNQIAHEGADFTISKREAIRVIELFKDVFEEFYLI